MGFSIDSIQHIKTIATKGTAVHVDPAKIDPLIGKYTP